MPPASTANTSRKHDEAGAAFVAISLRIKTFDITLHTFCFSLKLLPIVFALSTSVPTQLSSPSGHESRTDQFSIFVSAGTAHIIVANKGSHNSETSPRHTTAVKIKRLQCNRRMIASTARMGG
jgi:hypothetical protein